MDKKRLIIIGGGAAGFFCAVNAAKLNPLLEVIVLEKSDKILQKVKVSGGGRCNVTHACFSIAEMVKKYPRGNSFLKKAFHHFFTTDTIDWFNQRGVQLKTEADGRMFPVSNTSQTIINCFLAESEKWNITIMRKSEVKQLSFSQENAPTQKKFQVQLVDRIIYSDYVCITAGGYPKQLQYQWLLNTGHLVENPVPSLFTFNLPQNSITSLMGLSVQSVQIKIMGSNFLTKGPLLITHWGISGPAVLQLSAWAARELAAVEYNFKIMINWIPEFNENSLREYFGQLRIKLSNQKIANRNPFLLPQRLWEYHLSQSSINKDIQWAHLPGREQNLLIKNLCSCEFEVKGKTTFKEEFVTAGGIKLSEIDFNTMQSKLITGLFFAGEIINVDGITGGYNFQNAWTTGWIAAKTVSKLSLS